MFLLFIDVVIVLIIILDVLFQASTRRLRQMLIITLFTIRAFFFVLRIYILVDLYFSAFLTAFNSAPISSLRANQTHDQKEKNRYDHNYPYSLLCTLMQLNMIALAPVPAHVFDANVGFAVLETAAAVPILSHFHTRLVICVAGCVCATHAKSVTVRCKQALRSSFQLQIHKAF